MKDHPAGHERTTSEERLQHDIEELEGGTGWGGTLRWILILALAAIVSVSLYLVAGKRPPPPRVNAQGTVIIDTTEPGRGKLAASPTQFRWESIAGRSDYLFRILEKGNPSPVVERRVTENATTLTPDESQKLVPGTSYIWEVEARGQNGATIGSGRSFFDL